MIRKDMVRPTLNVSVCGLKPISGVCVASVFLPIHQMIFPSLSHYFIALKMKQHAEKAKLSSSLKTVWNFLRRFLGMQSETCSLGCPRFHLFHSSLQASFKMTRQIHLGRSARVQLIRVTPVDANLPMCVTTSFTRPRERFFPRHWTIMIGCLF